MRRLMGAALIGILLSTGAAQAAAPSDAASGQSDALPIPSRAPLPAPLPSNVAAVQKTPAHTPAHTSAQAGAHTARAGRFHTVDFRGTAVSAEARQMARMAFEGGDAQGLPFAVVDKQDARLLVFNADGRLAGATPALLGLARGDDLAPNVGQMVTTGIPPELRTTPSGRYDTQPGRNLTGETVIWVDYDAAFAIHRLRPSPASERRAERLASATPEDNRISLGCVIVTGEFFDQVVRPVLGQGAGVVYVLPEPAALVDKPVAMNAPALARHAAGRL